MSAAVTTSTSLKVVRPPGRDRGPVRTRRPRTWTQIPEHVGQRHPDDERLISSLREQITRLAQHYADDVSRLHARLAEAHAAQERARIAALRANERAATTLAQTRRVERKLSIVSELAVREKLRADRLQAAQELPWWAFRKRRALLTGAPGTAPRQG